MSTYGPAHWLLLAVTALVAAGLMAAGRRLRGTVAAHRLRTGLGLALLITTLGFQVFWLLPANFTVQQSLPVHLSDLLRLVASLALITRWRWAVAATYYWGLTLNLMALLTPDVDWQSPANLASYWSLHMLVMWAACHLTWGVGLHPTWRDLRRTVVITVAWAVGAYLINSALGTNYGYVNAKPSGGSMLDLLGPWPGYLVVAVLLLVLVWTLITWPWNRLGRRREVDSAG
ncbi:MAG: YwaF family protein [Propionibacteriaceae bacterium]